MMYTIKRIPIGVAALLLAVAVGACAIQLSAGDDQAPAPASATQETDPLASKLAQCQRKGATRQVGDGASANGSIPPSRKDESRLPSGYPSVPTPGGKRDE